jgi:hypothetical protein
MFFFHFTTNHVVNSVCSEVVHMNKIEKPNNKH